MGLVLLALLALLPGAVMAQTNRTPILRGVLQSDLDGGGKAITNLMMRGAGARRAEPWWQSGDASTHDAELQYNFGPTNLGNILQYIDKGPCAGKIFYWGDQHLAAQSIRVGGALAGNSCPRITLAVLDQDGEEYVTWAYNTNAFQLHFGYDAIIINIAQGNNTNHNLTFGSVEGTNTLAGTNLFLGGAVYLPDPLAANGRMLAFHTEESDGERNLVIGNGSDGTVMNSALAVNAQLTASSLSVGGLPVQKILGTTSTIDFGSTSAQSSSDSSGITLTGAAVGDAVFVGGPAAPNVNTCFTGYVSATDTVKVRFNNYSSGAVDPASATFRVYVFH